MDAQRFPRSMYCRRIDVLVADLWRWEMAYKDASPHTLSPWLSFRMDQRAAALEEARQLLRQAEVLIADVPRLQ